MRATRLALLMLGLLAAPAGAADGAGHDLELAGRLSATGVFSRAPVAPEPPAERDGEASLWRLRLIGRARPATWVGADAAWELRARGASGAQAAGGGLLPTEQPPPWRWRAWDFPAGETDRSEMRHELDRAAIALHLPRTEITAGRQAIGWGRGVLFTALDPFPAFGALEIDREWKRGVDAVRAEIRVASVASIEAVAAGGEEPENRIVAGRLRGYTPYFDAELAGGRRATDSFAGFSLSAPVRGAEIHVESVAVRTEDPLVTGGDAGDERLAILAVAGASHRFDVGRGPMVIAEWHYNGFGMESLSMLPDAALDADFRTRIARGDFRTLERHATGVQLAYPWSDELTAAAIWLHAPADGSGIAGPSLSWLVSDRVSLAGGAYLSYGARSRGMLPRSEYGSAPSTVFVQLSVTDGIRR